ncbi:hypothetical protein [Prevotella aurantiaca]|jgi:hypothetical protein|uniref:hypothetical protein n=1 Tax=Prevotella aurantiaca TaxID=596085 RepID=UPI0023F30500
MKLLNKKLNRMQWINKGILLFILLFALEPILSSSNIYWYLLAVSASIVLLVLIGFILGIFLKKIPIKNNLINERIISYGYLLASLLGLVIYYIYKGELLNFWIVIIFLNLGNIYLEQSSKDTKQKGT